jgi:hypothetical protein
LAEEESMKPHHLIAGIALFDVCALIACETGKTGSPAPSAAPAPSALAVRAPAPSDAGLPGWQIGTDVPGLDDAGNAPQEYWYAFAWHTFIALNWPWRSGGERGEPDQSQDAGAPGTGIPVWLTYKTIHELLLPDGARPGDWSSPPPPPPKGCPKDGAVRSGAVYGETTMISRQVLVVLNEAGGDPNHDNGPLIDQKGRYVVYDVSVNRAEYDYFRRTGYYNADTQQAAVLDGGFQGLPASEPPDSGLPPWAQQGALEIKASWRQIDRSDEARFISQRAYWVKPNGQCEVVTLGLVGLHLLQLTPSTRHIWFWATFEHIDNVPGDDPAVPDGGLSFNPGGNPPPLFDGSPDGNNEGFSYEPQPLPPLLDGGLPALPPVNVSRWTPIAGDVRHANALATAGLGAPLKYYELVNTLNPTGLSQDAGTCHVPLSDAGWPPGTEAGAPARALNAATMANTTIETYAQNACCTDCHGYSAVPQGVTQLPPPQQLQDMTYLLLNAQAPGKGPADVARRLPKGFRLRAPKRK